MNKRSPRAPLLALLAWGLILATDAQAQTLMCVPPGAPAPQAESGLKPCPAPGSDPSHPNNGLNPNSPAAAVQRQLQQMMSAPGGPAGANRMRSPAGAGGMSGVAGMHAHTGPGSHAGLTLNSSMGGHGGMGGPGGMTATGSQGGVGGMGARVAKAGAPAASSSPLAVLPNRGGSVGGQVGGFRSSVSQLNPPGSNAGGGTAGSSSYSSGAGMPFLRPSAFIK